jgi:hypothetical protein
MSNNSSGHESFEQQQQQQQQEQEQSQQRSSIQQATKRKNEPGAMSEPEKRNKPATMTSENGASMQADAQMQHAAKIKRCVCEKKKKTFSFPFCFAHTLFAAVCLSN